MPTRNLSAAQQKKFERECASRPLFAPIPPEVAGNGAPGSTFSTTPASVGLPNDMFSNVAATPSAPKKPGDLFQRLLDANRANTSTTSAQQQQSQAQAGNSLFGTAANNNTTQSTQPSGLFGNANNAQPSQTTGGTGLFGSVNTSNQTSQPATGTGLFGGANNTQTTQPSGGTSLFGGNNQPSLFGNNSTANNMFAKPAQPAPSTSLFGTSVNPPASNTGGSLFGGASSTRPVQQTPSLLGATQHAQMTQSAPFGRLSMGQAAGTQPQAASQVTVDNLRPTTRFEDCAPDVKKELEEIDKMIQQQEEHARQIEAFLLKHNDNVNSLVPDIQLIQDKMEDVDQALISGARGVDAQRQLTEKDKRDFQRIERVVTNLALPQGYQYNNMGLSGYGGMYGSQQRPQQQQSAPEGEDPSHYDTDLIGNYFAPMASELQATMSNYAGTLTEIENHIRVIEASTVAQAQQLAQGNAGASGQTDGQAAVREIASTFRDFEGGLLSVACSVGACRDGVTQLVLGRLNGY